MIAIIPVVCRIINLRPHAYTQPKCSFRLPGSLYSVIIEQLLDNGIKDFVFVIGYLGEKIKEYVESNYPNIQKKI